MKTKLNLLVIAGVASLCLSSAFAQKSKNDVAMASGFEGAHKTSYASSGKSLPIESVSQKARIAFDRSFPGSSDVIWSAVENKYAVDFIKDGMLHKNLYTAKGNLVYRLCYGSEKTLPADIRKMVKREYIDFNITQAVEANEGSRNVWIINLEDADNFVSVGVENGGMAELSRYTKSKD